MKLYSRIFAIYLLSGIFLPAFSYADATIVIMRHGEKPEQGLGQLTCKGLQRSLALAPVLLSRYGKPVSIYAPNPAVKKNDKGNLYAYIRPLATIEPTAIRVGLPVNLDYGMKDIQQLTKALLEQYEGTQFVAWEHHFADKLASNLLSTLGGDARIVPQWGNEDFDSLYVIQISGRGKDTQVTFKHENEGLNDLPDSCDR